MGENTAEYRTITSCDEKIKRAVQHDLVSVGSRLLEFDFVNAAQLSELENKMHTEVVRAGTLVSFLRSKVCEDKENYHKFIDKVLGADLYYYRSIIEQLQSTYESKLEAAVPEQSARVQSDTASGDDDQTQLKPKFGNEKCDEIVDTKKPARKLREGDKYYREVKAYAEKVELVIQTVNDNEFCAVLEYMTGPKFPDGQSLPTVVEFGTRECKVSLGMLSQHKAALVQTEMGSHCEEKLREALHLLPNVKGILAVGIAWGCKKKVELGDVLVATEIVGWDEEKWQDGKLIARKRFNKPMTGKFKAVFADKPRLWTSFERADKVKSKAQNAIVISTTMLINDEKIRRQVILQEPEAKGGEMEGHVLVKKILEDRPDLEVALVKGISDFADGHKHDEWQLTAAMAAVHYALYKLDDTDPDELFD